MGLLLLVSLSIRTHFALTCKVDASSGKVSKGDLKPSCRVVLPRTVELEGVGAVDSTVRDSGGDNFLSLRIKNVYVVVEVIEEYVYVYTMTVMTTRTRQCRSVAPPTHLLKMKSTVGHIHKHKPIRTIPLNI